VKRTLWLLLTVIPFAGAHADEGMWTLDNFPAEQVKAKYGVDVSDAWLDRVRLATVRLEGGCTGSFVSPSGLLLTNHHCIRQCITQLSSAERDIAAQGFLASSKDDEERCEAEQISVLMETEEITDQVSRALVGKNESEANEARKQTLTRLEKACEDVSEGARSCESVSLYNGGQYFLYKYKRYNDVRLVFAPESRVAAFGGDPDNFNFPRFCFDMSLLRVYEDGAPAGTPNYLSWRQAGPEEGEPVFVSGHPGSTERLLTVAELKTLRDVTLPGWLLRYAELRGRLIQFAKTGDEPRRIAQSPLLGIENAIKVRRNELNALLDDDLFERKQAQEASLREAVAQDPGMQARYGTAWDDMERAQKIYRTIRDQHLFIEQGAAFNSVLFGYARSLVRVAHERTKPNEERLREFTESAMPQLEQRLLAAQPVYTDLETLRLSFSLDKLRERLGPDDPLVKLVLGKESPDTLASSLVSGSTLADPAVRKALWEGGEEAIRDSTDPMLRLALEVDEPARVWRKRYENEVESPMEAASEKIARARFAVEGTSNYPDATFTLRVTYGTVSSWLEKGEPVPPFTVVGRAFERATGKDPFRLPESWLEARGRLGMDTRFNFIANTDITGGNSGSPLIDKDANLVGLAFDGNIHSIAGSYWFNPDNNRTVAVHPAVMLEALAKVYGADHLVRELGGR